MPRSEEEIKADMAALKAKGVHGRAGPMRVLRAELDALTPKPDVAPVVAPPTEPQTTTSVSASAGVVPCVAEMTPLPVSRWISEEEFIDKALVQAAASLDFKGGSMTGVVEKLYERTDAIVKVRRVVMEVLESVGPGEPWPQYARLNRNPNTGLPKLVATHAPANGIQTPQAPAPAFAHVTAAGDPVRDKPSARDVLAQMAGGAAADPKAMLKASILGDINSRPEPVREHKTA